MNLFGNGSTTATQELLLSGNLNNGEVYVIRNSAATLYNGTATVSNVTFFNGDDAIALIKISTGNYVDIIGRIGEDPGTAWTAGTISMLNHTLIRKPTVLQGVSINPTAGFPTLGTEWIQDSIDVATNLGAHSMTCPSSKNSITAQLLGNNSYCKGGVINISFQVSGSINSNNVYTAELSDETGSFNNASTIGTLTSSNLSDIIPAVIPANSTTGNAYRVRVRASSPQTVGSDNGANISIHNLPTVSAGTDQNVCAGYAVRLSASGAQTYFWEHGSDSSVTFVYPIENTSYVVTGIDANGCSKSDTVNVTVKSNPTPSISTQTPNNYVLESSIDNGNQWYINGNMIPGETNKTVDARIYRDGLYYTIVTSSNGCISDTSNKIVMTLQGIQNDNFNNIKIYPNPNAGEFQIETNKLTSGKYTVHVYNTLGILIETLTMDSTENSIRLKDVSAGIYYIIFENDNNIYRSSLIIK